MGYKNKRAKTTGKLQNVLILLGFSSPVQGRMTPPGDLTGRPLLGIQRPARQIATWNPNLYGGAHNGQSEITLHSRFRFQTARSVRGL